MANITAAQVKELRDKTAAGMMDCKKALTECDGDIQKAIEWLRKNGMSKAEKKASRSTSEGRIGVYIQPDGKKAAMVELLCETDFVAKNEKFLELLDGLCKHVVAANPKYVTKEDVPAGTDASDDECLMSQMCACGHDESIEQAVKSTIGTIGENIKVSRFCRFDIAEGEGRIGVYIHHDGKQAGMVELQCQSAAVAENEKFVELLDCLCKQVVAMDPKYVTKDEIPADVVAKETDILREATLTEDRELIEEAKRWEATVADAAAKLVAAEGNAKSIAEENLANAKKNAARIVGKAKGAQRQIDNADFLDMIVKGKVEKVLADKCLMSQEYALGDKETIDQMIKATSHAVGETVKVSRFFRFKIGE